MSERIDASRRWRQSQEEVEPAQLQKRRLADAMRVVIERLVTSDAPEDELALAADRLEQYAEHLSKVYVAFSSITGIGIILVFGSDNLDEVIALAGQSPTYRSLELHRVAVMASMGVALLFWAALWLVFFLRVRRQGLEQVKWRE